MLNLATLFRSGAWALLGALILAAAPGFAADDGVTRHFATHSGMHFYAGGDINIAAPAETVFAAGGTVTVRSKDVGEIIAAGGTVDLADTATNRIIAMGGDVIIGGTVARSLIAAGGNVTVRSGSRIGGDAVLAGGNVSLAGDVSGDVIAAGGTVTLSGRVGGDATLRSRKIILQPGTTIAGNLTYSSRDELIIPAGVELGGTLIRMDGGNGREFDFGAGRLIGIVVIAVLGGIVALSIFSGLALALFSRQIDAAARAVSEQPLQSLGLGILLIVALPVTVLILFVTIIGIPLGLFTLAVGGVLVGLGVVVAAFWTGKILRGAAATQQDRPSYGALLGWTLLGLVLFCLIGLMPFVGTMAQFFGIVTGFGALVLSMLGGTGPRGQSSGATGSPAS